MAYSWLQQPNDSYSNIMRHLEKVFPSLKPHGMTFDQFWNKERQTIFQYCDLYGITTAEAIVAVLINKYGIAESKIQEIYMKEVEKDNENIKKGIMDLFMNFPELFTNFPKK